jgi:hypothetical protein
MSHNDAYEKVYKLSFQYSNFPPTRFSHAHVLLYSPEPLYIHFIIFMKFYCPHRLSGILTKFNASVSSPPFPSPPPPTPHSEYLLVTETREQRREWMDELQKQNPKLLEQESESQNTLQVQRHA